MMASASRLKLIPTATELVSLAKREKVKGNAERVGSETLRFCDDRNKKGLKLL